MNKLSSTCKNYIRESRRTKAFGITPEMYAAMLKEQGHSCYLCSRHESELPRILAVDHCHATGTVRKLLCDNCNVALGHFKDNTILLEKAIQYLKEYE